MEHFRFSLSVTWVTLLTMGGHKVGRVVAKKLKESQKT